MQILLLVFVALASGTVLTVIALLFFVATCNTLDSINNDCEVTRAIKKANSKKG